MIFVKFADKFTGGFAGFVLKKGGETFTKRVGY